MKTLIRDIIIAAVLLIILAQIPVIHLKKEEHPYYAKFVQVLALLGGAEE